LEDQRTVKEKYKYRYSTDRIGGRGLDWCGSGQEQVVGPCAHGNEPCGSIKCYEFSKYLINYELFTYDCATKSQSRYILSC
jgi:hypothetical protein